MGGYGDMADETPARRRDEPAPSRRRMPWFDNLAGFFGGEAASSEAPRRRPTAGVDLDDDAAACGQCSSSGARSDVQSVAFAPGPGPLEWLVSWVEEARTSYMKTDIPAGQFSFAVNDASADQFFTSGGVQWVGLIRSKVYSIQIIGADNSLKGVSAGHPLDSPGPPSGFTFCTVDDETSVPASGLATEPPGGCQSEQESSSLRFYWEAPTESGYEDNAAVTVLAYTIQWSLDETFATGVSEEDCTDGTP
ncbi:hypothetical protein T484DRAFT_1920825 [Baffinella frigidus]|nr:hypothetical protein T484DRAFT_1920825 [Cryptophyta sp. CCMP2293]